MEPQEALEQVAYQNWRREVASGNTTASFAEWSSEPPSRKRVFVLVINEDSPAILSMMLDRVADQIGRDGIGEGISDIEVWGKRVGGWALT